MSDPTKQIPDWAIEVKEPLKKKDTLPDWATPVDEKKNSVGNSLGIGGSIGGTVGTSKAQSELPVTPIVDETIDANAAITIGSFKRRGKVPDEVIQAGGNAIIPTPEILFSADDKVELAQLSKKYNVTPIGFNPINEIKKSAGFTELITEEPISYKPFVSEMSDVNKVESKIRQELYSIRENKQKFKGAVVEKESDREKELNNELEQVQTLKKKAAAELAIEGEDVIEANIRTNQQGNLLNATTNRLMAIMPGSTVTGLIGISQETTDRIDKLPTQFVTGLNYIKNFEPVVFERITDALKNGLPISESQVANITQQGLELEQARLTRKLQKEEITPVEYQEKVLQLNTVRKNNVLDNKEVVRAFLSDGAATILDDLGKSKSKVPNVPQLVAAEYMLGHSWNYSDAEIKFAAEKYAKDNGLDPQDGRIQNAIKYLQDNEGAMFMQNSIAKAGGVRELFKGLAEPIRGISSSIEDLGKSSNDVYVESQSQGNVNVSEKRLKSEDTGVRGVVNDVVKGTGQFVTQAGIAYLTSGAVGLAGKAALGRGGVAALEGDIALADMTAKDLIGKALLTTKDGIATYITSYAQVYDSNLKNALNYTSDNSLAKRAAAINSSIEGATELFLSPLDIAKGIASKFRSKGTTEGLLKVLSDKNLMQNPDKLRDFLSATLKGVGGTAKVAGAEIGEEFVTQIADYVTNAYLNPDSETFQNRDLQNELAVTAYQTGLSMAIPALLNGVGAANANTFSKGSLLVAAQNRLKLIEGLDEDLALNNIDQDEYNEKAQIINTAAVANANLPLKADGAKLNTDEKADYIFSVTSEKVMKEKIEKSDDEAEKRVLEGKIKTQQDFRTELLGTPTVVQQAVSDELATNAAEIETQQNSTPETDIIPALKEKLTNVTVDNDADLLTYAIDKVAEAPGKMLADLGEPLFSQVLAQVPTGKLQENLDFLLDKNPDSEDVMVLDKIISEREAEPAASTPVVPKNITKEAEDLIASVGEGSMPTFITKNLEKIAADNGIEITGKMTASDVVNALKEKQSKAEPTPVVVYETVVEPPKTETVPANKKERLAAFKNKYVAPTAEITPTEKKQWNELSMQEKLALAKENLPEVDKLSNVEAVKVADQNAKMLLAKLNKTTNSQTIKSESDEVSKNNSSSGEANVSQEANGENNQSNQEKEVLSNKGQPRKVAPVKDGFTANALKRADAKKIFAEVRNVDEPTDAEQAALEYIANNGGISAEAIDEVAGTVKRARLNTGKENLSQEVKSRDYYSPKETGGIDAVAHYLWERYGQRIPETEIKDALMNVIRTHNTRLDAGRAYLEKYSPEYIEQKQQEKFYQEHLEEIAAEERAMEEYFAGEIEREFLAMQDENYVTNLIEKYEQEIKGENKQSPTETEKSVNTGTGNQRSATENAERIKQAELEVDRAKSALKKAEDKFAGAQAKQGNLLGGNEVQKDLFANNPQEVKNVLDPLKQKVREAEANLEAVKKSIGTDNGQPNLFSIQSPTTQEISDMKDIVKDYVDEGTNTLSEIQDDVAKELGDNSQEMRDLVEKAYNEFTKDTDFAPKEITSGVIGRVGKFLSRLFGGTAASKVFILKDTAALQAKAEQLQGDVKYQKSLKDYINIVLTSIALTGTPLQTANTKAPIATEINEGDLKARNTIKKLLTDYYAENNETVPEGVIDRALKVWERVGKPEILPDSTKNNDRAFANQETMVLGNITNFDDLVAELSHAAQYVSKAELDERGYATQEELDKVEYDRKGSVEYDAHKLIEPMIATYILDGTKGMELAEASFFSNEKSEEAKKTFDKYKLNEVLYMKNPNGDILGFTHNNIVYLNADHLNPNTPIHEAGGHIFLEWAKQNNPEVYARGMQLTENSKYLKEVKANEFYKAEASKLGSEGSKEYNDYMKHEALAMAIGDRGAQFVGETRKKDFKEWLNNLWNKIKAAAGFKDITAAELQNLTFDEFTKRAAADILREEEVKAEPKPKEAKPKREAVEGEGELTGVTHAETDAVAAELGLPTYDTKPETVEEWDAEVDKRIKEDPQAISKMLNKLKSGVEADKYDQRMMMRYLASLKARINISPTNELLNEYKEAKDLSDIMGGREVAKSLVARKGLIPVDDSMAGMLVQEIELNQNAPLTEKQKEQVIREYEEIKAAENAYNEKVAKLEDADSKKESEEKIKRTKSLTPKNSKKTHEDYVKERKKIEERISEKLKKARSEFNVTPIPYAKELFAIAPEVTRLMKSYIEEGVSKLADIITNIQQELKPYIPEIKEQDVHDIIAGNYNQKRKTKNEIAAAIFDLREEAKLITRLSNLINGIEPTNERQKIKRNQEIESLRNKIKEFGNEKREAANRIKQAQKEEERLIREFEKEQNAIEKQRLKEAAQKEKDRIRELEKKTPEEIALQTFKTRTANRIKELEDDLATGNFDIPVKKEPIKLDKEALELKDKMVKLKMDRQLRIIKQQQQNLSKWEKAQKGFAEILNIPRTLMTILDYSAVLRQGIVQSVSHPSLVFNVGVKDGKIKLGGAGVDMIKAGVSQKMYDRWFFDLKETPRFALMEESGLGITDSTNPLLSAREEGFMSSLAEKIPLIGQTLKIGNVKIPGTNLVKGSERSYSMFLNKLRVDVFNRFADAMEERGLTFENSPEQYKQMADYVNNSTGRGNVGVKLNKIAPLLNSLFFSPRLIASRLNMLTYLVQPRFYKTVPKEVRAAYFKDMGKFIGLGMLVLGLFSLGGGGDDDEDAITVETDPRSSDYGKIKQGNTRWDIWGGFQQYVRVAAQAISGQRKSANTGKMFELSGEGPFGKTRGDVLLNFTRGKLAPVPAMAIDIFSGRTTSGDKVLMNWGGKEDDKEISIDRYLKEHLIPLTFTGTQEAIKDQGIKAIFTVGVPSVFGVGTQTYDTNKK